MFMKSIACDDFSKTHEKKQSFSENKVPTHPNQRGERRDKDDAMQGDFFSFFQHPIYPSIVFDYMP